MRKWWPILGVGALILFLIGLWFRPLWRNFFKEAQSPTPMLSPTQAPTGRDEGLIAFVSTRDGNSEIYVMHADGTQAQNLTRDPGDDFSPRWSPDGQQLAFISTRTGNAEIFVMDAAGAQPRQLTHDSTVAWGAIWQEGHLLFLAQDSSQLSWSPDGTRLAATRALLKPTDHGWRESQIYLVNVDGSGSQALTEVRGGDHTPRWSPDGWQIAFVREQYSASTLMLTNVAGDEFRVVQANPINFEWSSAPSGPLAYLSAPATDIWLQTTADLAPQSLIRPPNPPAVYVTTFQWSPDGARLALAARTMASDSRTGQLYLIWSDGSGLLRLTETSADYGAPTWSWDGQALAFEMRQADKVNIYRVDISEAYYAARPLASQPLTTSGQDFNPQWQP